MNNWSLGNSRFDDLYNSEVLWLLPISLLQLAVFTSTPRLSQRKMSRGGHCPSLLKFSKPSHSPSPLNMSSQLPIWLPRQRYLIDMFISTQRTRVSQPRAVPALGIVAHGPRFQMSCHISLWHQSTLENRKHKRDGWNAFKKTLPDSQGDAEPCWWGWVTTYAQQNMPKGRVISVPTVPTEHWLKCLESAALDRVPFTFSKYLLNLWSQAFVPWTFNGPKR